MIVACDNKHENEGVVMFDRMKSFISAPIPLRLIVGFGFMEHGYAKLLKGPEAFASILHALAVPAPHLMAYLTILTELLGGFVVLIGAFIPLVSIPMAIVLLTAMFSVHWRYGFSSIKLVEVTPAGAKFGPPGYECDLLYLACLVALVLVGSGPLSFDGGFTRRLPRNSHVGGWRLRALSRISHLLSQTGVVTPTVQRRNRDDFPPVLGVRPAFVAMRNLLTRTGRRDPMD